MVEIDFRRYRGAIEVIMVKLTAELIDNSRQYINPVQDRELNLRGKDWIWVWRGE